MAQNPNIPRRLWKMETTHSLRTTDVVDSQPVFSTLFALKMAPVEGRNVRSRMFLKSLAVIFGLKNNRKVSRK